MKIQLGLILTSVALLGGCSASSPAPPPEAPPTGCRSPYPVGDGSRAVGVEGFGGPDAQVIVTRRQPTRVCTTAAVQARDARLGGLR